MTTPGEIQYSSLLATQQSVCGVYHVTPSHWSSYYFKRSLPQHVLPLCLQMSGPLVISLKACSELCSKPLLIALCYWGRWKQNVAAASTLHNYRAAIETLRQLWIPCSVKELTFKISESRNCNNRWWQSHSDLTAGKVYCLLSRCDLVCPWIAKDVWVLLRLWVDRPTLADHQ